MGRSGCHPPRIAAAGKTLAELAKSPVFRAAAIPAVSLWLPSPPLPRQFHAVFGPVQNAENAMMVWPHDMLFMEAAQPARTCRGRYQTIVQGV
jgi:hypothetical protein